MPTPLVAALGTASNVLGGAVALISGRTIANLDAAVPAACACARAAFTGPKCASSPAVRSSSESDDVLPPRTDRDAIRRGRSRVSRNSGRGQAVLCRGSLSRRPRTPAPALQAALEAVGGRSAGPAACEFCPAIWSSRSSAPHSTRAGGPALHGAARRSRGEADLSRRRRHRRAGFAQWSSEAAGLFGRSDYCRARPAHFPIPPRSDPGWRDLLPRRQVTHDNRQGRNLDFALIGNCRVAALVDTQARIVWWCTPRFDSDPVFSRLLAGDEEKGFCDVVLADQVEAESSYVRNTAIVETILTRLRRAAPSRSPTSRRGSGSSTACSGRRRLFRRIEPIAGLPRITIRVRPTYDYGRPVTEKASGSSHIRYLGGDHVVRLSTDAPLSYIEHETSFALTRPLTMVFGQDEPFRSRVREHRPRVPRADARILAQLGALPRPALRVADGRDARRHHAEALPVRGDRARSSPRTRPRSPRRRAPIRNWDYRYCWLRDAFFVVHALNRLGATQTMEDYINYITNIAVENQDPLQPVHGIVPGTPLTNGSRPNLDGFKNNKPVRVGNAAVDPGPARRLWQRRAGRRPRCSSTSACRRWATRRCSGSWSRSAAQAAKYALRARRGHCGNSAASARRTPIRRRCAGSACDRLGAHREAARAADRGRDTGAARPRGSSGEILDAGLERGAQALDGRLRAARPRRERAAAARTRLHRRRPTSASSRPSRPSAGN